jgi:hypothetical protein
MSAYANVAGTFKTVSAIYVKMGGAWKPVAGGFTKTAAGWRQVSGAGLSATPSPGSANGTVASPNFAASNSVSAVPAGGSPPYTHSWRYNSGDAGISPLGSLSAPSLMWGKYFPSPGSTSGVWSDLITDSIGQQTIVNVPISLTAT